MKNTDLESLEKTLRSSGGRARFGDLRRLAGLDPQVIMRLVRDYPDRLTESEETTAPEVILGSRLDAAERTFLAAVRGAGRTGIAAARLWQKRKLTTAETTVLATRYAELVRTEKKDKRMFYFWITKEPATPPAMTEPLLPEAPPVIEPSNSQADDPIPAQAVELPSRNLAPDVVPILDQEWQEMRFKPPCSGMAIRRRAAQLTLGGHRERNSPI